MNDISYQDVLNFWFKEIEQKNWFKKSDEFDLLCKNKFEETIHRVATGETWRWRESAEGRLAEIILLDQLTRNIYRNTPASFKYDPLALILSQEAIHKGYDKQLESQSRVFLYMPFMHSESALIHEQAVELFEALGIKSNLDYELRHKAIIDRFGRYPHRNEILGRESTSEELEFLKQPGSGF